MERCSDLRRRGREGISGKWMEAVLAVLVFSVLIQIPVAVINSVFGVSTAEMMQNLYGTSYGSMTTDGFPDEKVSSLSYLYLLLVSGPLTYGITLFFMRLFRGSETEIATVMCGFEKFLKTLGLSLYMAVFIFLWSLLFIIPGIIAAFRYSQAYYILADDPEKSISQCVNESKALMAGNKGKLFALNLSFIGWYFLAMIPVGIVTYFVASLAAISPFRYVRSYQVPGLSGLKHI